MGWGHQLVDQQAGSPVSINGLPPGLYPPGPIAVRPAPSYRNAGWHYFATDVGGGQLFQSTGFTWLPISPPGGTGLSRNALYNSAHNLWQRGTSFAAVATGAYGSDGWKIGKVAATGVATVAQVGERPTVAPNVPYSSYSLKVTVTTAQGVLAVGDYFTVYQVIEGFNWAQYWQRPLVLSFWVKSTTPGIYCVFLEAATAIDRALVAEYVIFAANTWEYKSIRLPASPSGGSWGFTNGGGALLGFCLACGPSFQTEPGYWVSADRKASANQTNIFGTISNTWQFTQAQLEVGYDPTPYDERPFAQELAIAERYYEKSYPIEVAPGTNAAIGWFRIVFPLALANGVAANTNIYVPFKVKKRATPTFTSYSYLGTSGQFSQVTTDRGTFVAGNTHSQAMPDCTMTPNAAITANWDLLIQWTANASL